MDIKPTDRSLRQLLESGFYKIPRFQRPYSWEQINVEDFWDDAVASEDESYFIGSFVLYPEKKGSNVLMVVDGQQRLTTITILLAAIRNAFDALKYADLAKGIQGLIETQDLDSKLHFILQTETSYPYLQESIQKRDEAQLEGNAGSEEAALKAAFDLLTAKVESMLEAVESDASIAKNQKKKTKKARLISVRDKLMALQLITILLANEDDAYLIFETLNTRGKDLGLADLLKNHFTRQLRPQNQGVDAAKDKWNKIRKTIDESAADLDINRFFYHSWLSRYSYVGRAKVFREAKKAIKPARAQAFLDDFVEDVGHYRRVLEPEAMSWPKEELEIQRSLRALNTFRVLQPVPMTLAIVRAVKNKQLTKKQARNVLRSLEQFHAQFTGVTSQRTGGGTARMYASSAEELAAADSKDDRQQVLGQFLEKLRERVPSYDEFEANFGELMFTSDNTRDKPIVRYLLEQLDRHGRSGATIDYNEMAIEHIASERPATGRALPPDLLGALGNLILLATDTNSKLGNADFKKKREVYRQDGAPIDSVLENASKWGRPEVRQRTKKLSRLLYDTILSI